MGVNGGCRRGIVGTARPPRVACRSRRDGHLVEVCQDTARIASVDEPFLHGERRLMPSWLRSLLGPLDAGDRFACIQRRQPLVFSRSGGDQPVFSLDVFHGRTVDAYGGMFCILASAQRHALPALSRACSPHRKGGRARSEFSVSEAWANASVMCGGTQRFGTAVGAM